MRADLAARRLGGGLPVPLNERQEEMNSFMVLATFTPGTPMDEVLAVVDEEQRRLGELQSEGKVGALYLATAARRSVFLEVFGADVGEAEATVRRLPMSRWWDLDVYPLNPPAGSEVAS